ncbi:MAG: DUF4093 domain-containing protein [Ruminococcus sp.]|nr:DUF4093 domain-containing protein [Ruminococcus sp.]
MIRINQAVIVEGKYDKIKLSSIIDGIIIVTNGFRIFKDTEKLELIRYYASTTGIIILTDSDSAGRKIRGYIKGAVNGGDIRNVYIPDILGKEKRKEKPSAEGKLGVEGVDADILLDAFEKAGITASESTCKGDISKLTLFELGLSGAENSRFLRENLQKSLGLPSVMSASSLVEVLNTMMTADELKQCITELKEEFNDI